MPTKTPIATTSFAANSAAQTHGSPGCGQDLIALPVEEALKFRFHVVLKANMAARP